MSPQEKRAKISRGMPLIQSPYTPPTRKLEILEDLRPALGEDEFKRNVETVRKEVAAACKKLEQLGFDISWS